MFTVLSLFFYSPPPVLHFVFVFFFALSCHFLLNLSVFFGDCFLNKTILIFSSSLFSFLLCCCTHISGRICVHDMRKQQPLKPVYSMQRHFIHFSIYTVEWCHHHHSGCMCVCEHVSLLSACLCMFLFLYSKQLNFMFTVNSHDIYWKVNRTKYSVVIFYVHVTLL